MVAVASGGQGFRPQFEKYRVTKPDVTFQANVKRTIEVLVDKDEWEGDAAPIQMPQLEDDGARMAPRGSVVVAPAP
eukprot:8195258-Pyramimonas_sp.AAC.1